MTWTWEYQTVDVSAVEFDQLDDLLAGFAEQGWKTSPRIDSVGSTPMLQIVLRRHVAGGVSDLVVASSSL